MPVFAPISLLIAVFIDCCHQGKLFRQMGKGFHRFLSAFSRSLRDRRFSALWASLKLGFYIRQEYGPDHLFSRGLNCFFVTALWNHRSDIKVLGVLVGPRFCHCFFLASLPPCQS
jgi:hypothetical protein